MTELLDARQLEAATRCVEALIDAGTTALSVEQLHAAAGTSKRTFHRWFPAKERAIRPYYAAVTRDFTARILDLGPPTTETVARAWTEVVLGADNARGLALFALVHRDPAYWAVFLEVLEDGERTIAEELERFGDRRDAEVAAVAVVGSSRLALTAGLSGAEAAPEFARYLTAFAPRLLAVTSAPPTG